MTISKKRSEASKRNGAKSKRPNETGKTKLNAVADGLFATSMVIESLGEKREDFEALELQFRSGIQPANGFEENLIHDLVASCWKKRRLERVETAEIQRALLEIKLGEDMSRQAELSALISSFELLLGQRSSAQLR